ncbi:MAG: pantetheine-phosphate adenylyltransferase [Vampirovibrio sp.]|jgi:pantetheine-phosphate adenylyltransferase
MTVAVYPGSFDPVTKGHEDLIRRGASLFDTLEIAVAHNPAKPNSLFTPEARVAMLEASIVAMGLQNVRVSTFAGLTVHFAKSLGADCLIRGLRVISDFEYECSMYQTNAKINPQLDTCFMMPSLEYQFLSSRMVRELASHGENVDAYVSPHVATALAQLF